MFVSENEWMYKKIIEASQDAVIMADRNGVLCLWNNGAETIFGYSSDEVIGKTLDLIIPNRFRERHWNGYMNVIATSVTKYSNNMLAVPAQKKDGTLISIEFTITMLADESGFLHGIAAIIRDVTTRRNEENKIKEKLAALETTSNKENSLSA